MSSILPFAVAQVDFNSILRQILKVCSVMYGFTEADLVSADSGSDVAPLRLWDRLQQGDPALGRAQLKGKSANIHFLFRM